MARTIGAKYKNMIRKFVNQAHKKGIHQFQLVGQYVREQMPKEAFDTWEGAWSEIERIAEDLAMNGKEVV